ncbi:CHAT domain-containing protein [Anaerolineales bacterium HSG24]|nr:CHAT domain-containing protein [Anaerolineales bacterium HSG24]
MHSFTITITGQPDQYQLSATGPENIRVEDQPFGWQPTSEQRATLTQLADEQARVAPSAVEALGLALYDALFSRDIAVAFSQAQTKVGAKNLRIRLQIEPPELAALPWEAMRDKTGWLALDSGTPLVRRLTSEISQRIDSIEINKPLRILFIGSSPKNLDSLDVVGQYQQLQKQLTEPVSKKDVALTALFHPTQEQLRRELLKDYHIIYFAGHGAPAKTETSFDGTTKEKLASIYIDGEGEQENGQAVPGNAYPLTAETLAGMLKGRQNTRLLFLAACNTSATAPTLPSPKPGEGQLLSGFAQELIQRANLPAMVAMQYFISDKQAMPLTAHFFAAIAEFNPVDVALAEARNVVVRQGQPVGRDVFAPVLYLQAENASLFKKAWNRAALGLVAVLAVVLVLAGIGGYFLEGQRADEQARADVEATQRAIAVVTRDAQATGEAIAVVTGEAEGERANTEATRVVIARETANAEATQRVIARETANAEATAKMVEQARADEEEKQRVVVAEAISLAEQSLGSDDMERALFLALQSSAVTQKEGFPIIPQSQKALLNALNSPLHAVYGGHHLTEQITQQGATDIKSARFSRDSRYLVVGSRDDTASIFDVNSGQLLHRLQGHNDAVLDVDISSDTQYVATAGRDNIAIIWDAETGELIHVLEGHTNPESSAIRNIRFSPDNQYVVTGGDDKTARIWNVKTGVELHALQVDESGVRNINFSPDGKRMMGGFSSTHIWDIETGEHLITLENPNGIFSLDGQYIVDAHGKIWDTTTFEQLRQLENTDLGEANIANLVVSSDSQYIAGSQDNKVYIWSANTGQIIYLFDNHAQFEEVYDINFSYDSRYLISGSRDRTARIWSTETGELLRTITGHDNFVNVAKFSPDNRYIVTGIRDGMVFIWKFIDKRELHKIDGGQIEYIAGYFDLTQDYIVTNANEVWQVKTGQKLSLSFLSNITGSINFSSDNRYVAITNENRNAQIWDHESSKLVSTLSEPYPPSVSFDINNQFVFGSITEDQEEHPGFKRSTYAWDIKTGQKMQDLGNVTILLSPDGHYLSTYATGSTGSFTLLDVTNAFNYLYYLDGFGRPIGGFEFSPDSQYILITVQQFQDNESADIWIIDSETGQELHVLQGHEGRVSGSVFSPDSLYFVTTGEDARGIIWDAKSGQQLVTLEGHTAPVLSPKFSPDGNYVVTGSDDKTVRLWDSKTGLELETLFIDDKIRQVDFTQDGRYIVAGTASGLIYVWKTYTVEQMLTEASRRIRPSWRELSELEGLPPTPTPTVTPKVRNTPTPSATNTPTVTPTPTPVQQQAIISLDKGPNSTYDFGEQIEFCFSLTMPASAKATLYAPDGREFVLGDWDSLGGTPECISGPVSTARGDNRVELVAGDGSRAEVRFVVQ